MIHAKLAWHSLAHHLQQYLPFIITNSILIAINYIFIALSVQRFSMATISARLGLVFILTISVIFMFYVNGFLLKQRSRELGLYNMLGLTKHDLHLVVGVENMILYGISTVCGIIVGIVFEKLAFLMIHRLINTPMLATNFSWFSIGATALIFAIAFGLLFIYDALHLRHVNPLNLWRDQHVGEKEPKAHWILGCLGIAILGWGYYLSVTTKPSSKVILTFCLAILLVIIGTYLIFIVGSTMLLRILQKNKKFYYQPNHFISVSGMLYRMKQNGASLATICLLCTAVLVAMISSVSLLSNENNVFNQWNPYDVMMTTEHQLTANNVASLEQHAQQNHIKLGKINTVEHTLPTYGAIKNNAFESANVSDATCQLATLTLQDYNRLQHTNYHLSGNEVLLFMPSHTYRHATININNQTYHVRQIKQFKLSYNYGHSIMQPMFIVTKNAKTCEQINNQPWVHVYGFNTYGTTKNQITFGTNIQSFFNLDNAMISARAVMQADFQNIFGDLLFISIFIALVMVIVTALMIYYKQLSEGYADRDRFNTMRKIGLDYHETKKVIHSQVLIVFMLPIIGAAINLAFAIPALKNTMTVLSMYNGSILFTVSLITLGVFIIGYLILYMLTAKAYQHIINQPVHNNE